MTNCTRCKSFVASSDLIGCNVFDASTGLHITTKRYCRFCAGVLGLIAKVKA